MNSITKKLGARAGMRAVFINAPADVMSVIDVSYLKVADQLKEQFDYIHLFCKTLDELEIRFPRMKNHLTKAGMLVVSWPRAGHMSTDLSSAAVVRIGQQHGMTESKPVDLTAAWSALRFTFPESGS